MSLTSALMGKATGNMGMQSLNNMKGQLNDVMNAVAGATQTIRNAQQDIISKITGVVDTKIQNALATNGTQQPVEGEYENEGEYADGEEYYDEEYNENGNPIYNDYEGENEEYYNEEDPSATGGGRKRIQYTGTLPTAQSGGGSHENVYLDKPYSGQIYVTEVNGEQLYFIQTSKGQFRPLSTYTAARAPTATTRSSPTRAKAKNAGHRATRSKPRAHSTRKRKQAKKALTRRR